MAILCLGDFIFFSLVVSQWLDGVAAKEAPVNRDKCMVTIGCGFSRWLQHKGKHKKSRIPQLSLLQDVLLYSNDRSQFN